MKFIISQKDLLVILNRIQNVVSPKATIPILSNILIETSGGELTITATDLTVGIRCYTSAKIIQEGATTIPARRFTQLIRELTTPTVEIKTNDKDITEVIADSSKFKIHGMSRTEFPALPELTDAVRFSLPQKDLHDMFYRTAFSVSKEDNRYVLTGVCLQIGSGQATFIGTDGKRLAKSQLPSNLDPAIEGRFIIPLKAVEEILKNLGGNEVANIYLMPDKVAIEANQSILITKLLTGDYPDVERVIPQKPESVMTIHKDELISLLRQVSLFTSDEYQSVRFSFGNGELSLSANASEIGEGKVSMPVNYSGQQLDIAFNPTYFLDILRHSKEETIQLGLLDAFNPGLILEQDEEGPKSSPLFVLMPMRLD